MILIENEHDDLVIISYYYKQGWSFIGYNTFEEYKNHLKLRSYPYYICDIENLNKMVLPGRKKYISYNDMFEITSSEYIQKFREKKLKRILK